MSRLRSVLRHMVLVLLPSVLRQRLFAVLTHPTQQDIQKKRIDPELVVLGELLQRIPAGVFIDVGANIGTYVYEAGRHVSPERIYALEPQSHYARDLQLLFRGVHVDTLALSDVAGSAMLTVPLIGGVPYPTRGTVALVMERGQTGTRTEEVRTMTLDSYVAGRALEYISVIKIDVEGHEAAVIDGARETLHRLHPALIVEIEQRHHAEPIALLIEKIIAHGYAGWYYDQMEHAFVSVQQFSVALHQRIDAFKTSAYVQNFLFLPEGEMPPVLPVLPSV